MFLSADLLVVSCLFLTVHSQTGKILPPQNVSLTWIGIKPQLTWAVPQPSTTNCTYDVSTVGREMTSRTVSENVTSPWTGDIIMNGGFLNLSVSACCHGEVIEPAVINVRYPEPVKNLNCYVKSREQTHCSWDKATIPDLRFYYILHSQGPESSKNDSSTLQECSSYTYTEDQRTGCNLQADCRQKISMLFNGTSNNSVFRNTFKKYLVKDVRPPALNWTVSKNGSKFNISWSTPDICDSLEWTIIINYTECNKAEKLDPKGEGTSVQLNRVLHCPYRIKIKAKSEGGASMSESPWSEEKYFGADKDPNASLYAAIIIPLMFACLAALAFVYCRKNKEYIFPKVPQPRDLLSDISDNNNKSAVCNLYIPAEEEQNCKITLVVDPQIRKPAC